MLESSLRIEEEVQGIERRVSGRDRELAGPLRVAMSDIAVQTLLPQLRAFGERYPDVTLELVVSNRPSDLARREADVALRVTESPAQSLVGRRLASVASSIFASRDYLARHPDASDLEAQAWLGFDGSLAEIPMARWMREHVPRARIVARFDSSLLAWAAVRAGLGIAMLPCVVADADPGLRRVAPDFLLRGSELWALTHADLRSAARVRAFLDFIRDAILELRELIEGRSPQPAAGASPSERAPRRARGA
jgi:DNA-binding transcriptional LysR family regulator